MSYPELRNFSEYMRALGYQRPVSIENFRTPNFELVADCLSWLVRRYDPSVDLNDDISTEDDRVMFLQSVAQVMQTKARITLNQRRLYEATGRSVQELLKLASVLYQSLNLEPGQASDASAAAPLADLESSAKLHDLQLARQIASEITSRGSDLYDLLGVEPDLRAARLRALARPVDSRKIEKEVRGVINQLKQEINAVSHKMDNLGADEANLESKIENKKAELERSSKRLRKLKEVKPSFMAEYEQFEAQLGQVYDVYVEKFRNLEFLEHQLGLIQEQEARQVQEADRMLEKLSKRYRQREKDHLLERRRGHDDDDEDEDDELMRGVRVDASAVPGDEIASGRRTSRRGLISGVDDESDTTSSAGASSGDDVGSGDDGRGGGGALGYPRRRPDSFDDDELFGDDAGSGGIGGVAYDDDDDDNVF